MTNGYWKMECPFSNSMTADSEGVVFNNYESICTSIEKKMTIVGKIEYRLSVVV